MTQTEAILDALRDGQTITPLEALDRFGCFRLAARISDAKAELRADEEIVTESVAVGGKVVARYRLRKRALPAGGVQTSLWTDPRQ